MTLDDWLKRNKISDAEFAFRVGVHRSRIHRYKTGAGVPSFKVMARIELATNGKVKLADIERVQK